MAGNWLDLWDALSRRDLIRKTGFLTGAAFLLGGLVDKAAAQPVPPQSPLPGMPGLPPLPGAAALSRTIAVGGSADYFLLIDGIMGESHDQKHKGQIDIESFSWGESRAGGEKVAMQDFHFVAKTSAASPRLFLACAAGEHFKGAILSARRAGGKDQQEYLKYTMSDVLVSSYQTGGVQHDVPTDQFSLNFGRIDVEYRPMMPDGSMGMPVKGGFDVKAKG